MCTFNEQFAASARPMLAEAFGVAVSYVVPGSGGSTTACRARWGVEEQVEDQDDPGRKLVTEVTAGFSYGLADAENGVIPAPNTQHEVVKDGKTWSVLKVLELTGAEASLRLRLSKRLQNERPGLVGRP